MRIRQGVKDTVRLMMELIGLLSRRFGWALLLGLALAVMALLLFAGLADEVLEGDTRRFDDAVRLAIHRSASPPLTTLTRVVTSLGSVWFLTLVGLCVVLGFLKAGRRRAALLFAITMAGATLLNVVLKLSFRRTRPAPFFDTPLPSSYSFPSGHALASFCFYGALAAIVTARIRSRRWRAVVWTLAALLVVPIGFSRVYLGVHYPSDVLAGYAAATVWVAVVAVVDRLFRRGTTPRAAIIGRVRRLFHLCLWMLSYLSCAFAQLQGVTHTIGTTLRVHLK